MTKFAKLLLSVLSVGTLASCGLSFEESAYISIGEDSGEQASSEAADSSSSEGVKVNTYAEFVAADASTVLTVETYVQAKQSWWDNKATIYTQNEEGAYFIYNMPISEDEYNALVPGTKIRVTGSKTIYRGEIELSDVTSFEVLEGSYIAEAKDITSHLASEDLIDYQNQYVSFKDLIIEPSYNSEGNEVAFLYNWDGSGDKGSDLYFNVNYLGTKLNFTVESYLCGSETEVYQAVEAFKIGDVVDLSGYLYWYDGVNPHITSAKVNSNINTKSSGVSTYAQYNEAALAETVTVETYVQAKQSWWNDKAVIYTQDLEGAYFLYNCPCSEEVYNTLVPGTKIKVTGSKTAYRGEIEISDITSLEVVDGAKYIACAKDITSKLASEELINYQNQYVTFKKLEVVAADENGSAFLYNWDGSGDKGSDLYYKVSDGTNTYTFTVESYLCGEDTDVYKAVEALKVGDKVNVTCYLYWYDGVNPHTTSIAVVTE